MDFNTASGYIIQRLRRELNPSLTYHCVEHTLDVLEATRRLSEAEITDTRARNILETAALFHDAGMIIQYKDHESASARLAREVLPAYGYTAPDIDEIEQLIMVTKLPPRPYNHHEQIICDADLDYLGRNDFYIHSFSLRLEWKLNNVKNTTLAEWLDIQVKFLSEHQYFTKSAMLLRNETKLSHLEEIRRMVAEKHPESRIPNPESCIVKRKS
jgi:predicted metal-dependent HD superfamily phosphohydrolase